MTKEDILEKRTQEERLEFHPIEEWPWPGDYALRIINANHVEKAARLMLDGEPEFDENLAYQMPEKEQSCYIGCKK